MRRVCVCPRFPWWLMSSRGSRGRRKTFQKSSCIGCGYHVRLILVSGHGSVGRAQPCQGWGRGFEPRCPLQTQQPDYYGSRAFSYPSHGLEPERERALSKRGAFVASWRGRRQAAEASADPRSGYADAPLSAPTILRGSNEPRFLLTLRGPRAPHLAPQSSVAYIKYASLLFRGNLGHPEPARCRGRGSKSSVLFTNRSIRPRRLEPERGRAFGAWLRR